MASRMVLSWPHLVSGREIKGGEGSGNRESRAMLMVSPETRDAVGTEVAAEGG